MLSLEQAKKSDRVMKALTGMTVMEFESLTITFSKVLSKHKATRKPNRQRAVGGGRRHTLETAEDRLFFILFYVKVYPTLDLAGFFYGVDTSRPQRWVKELLPLLEEALGRELVLPARQINNMEDFLVQFPDVKDVFVDATERPVQRPQSYKRQKAHYSGRKARHTKKTLVANDEKGEILILSQTKPGARADYFRFKQSGLGEAIPSTVALWVDLGFQGIETDYPHLDVVIPHKKPKKKSLSSEQKADNKLISQIRIKAEHAICRLKRFRAVSDIYRNRNDLWADSFILIAAGLSNYHLRFT